MKRPPVDIVKAATELRLRTRKAQGLPPTCEDVAALRKVAVFVRAAREQAS